MRCSLESIGAGVVRDGRSSDAGAVRDGRTSARADMDKAMAELAR